MYEEHDVAQAPKAQEYSPRLQLRDRGPHTTPQP